MIQVVSLLFTVFKAVPALKDLFDRLVLAYMNYKDIQIDKDIREGIVIALRDHDQRELEKAISSTKSGEASGNPNTTIRHSRPH